MKKRIDLPPEKYEEKRILDFCKDILNQFRIDGLIDVVPLVRTERGEQLVKYYGNDISGIIHSFSRKKLKESTYIIIQKFEVFGLKDKSQMIVEYNKRNDVWEDAKPDFFVNIKGNKKVCNEIEEIVNMIFCTKVF